MTERLHRRRLVDLSVVTVSALSLAGAWLVVVDRDRSAALSGEVAPVAAPPSAPAPAARVGVAPASARSAPALGLRPVAAPRKRLVVRRRSRAS